jgi:hypothetical protein
MLHWFSSIGLNRAIFPAHLQKLAWFELLCCVLASFSAQIAGRNGNQGKMLDSVLLDACYCVKRRLPGSKIRFTCNIFSASL